MSRVPPVPSGRQRGLRGGSLPHSSGSPPARRCGRQALPQGTAGSPAAEGHASSSKGRRPWVRGQESRYGCPEPIPAPPAERGHRGEGDTAPRTPTQSKQDRPTPTHPIPAGPGLRPWGTPAPLVPREQLSSNPHQAVPRCYSQRCGWRGLGDTWPASLPHLTWRAKAGDGDTGGAELCGKGTPLSLRPGPLAFWILLLGLLWAFPASPETWGWGAGTTGDSAPGRAVRLGDTGKRGDREARGRSEPGPGSRLPGSWLRTEHGRVGGWGGWVGTLL